MFLIIGSATIIGAIISFFVLPDFPSTTKWLTEEERFIAVSRLEADDLGNTQSVNGIKVGESQKNVEGRGDTSN